MRKGWEIRLRLRSATGASAALSRRECQVASRGDEPALVGSAAGVADDDGGKHVDRVIEHLVEGGEGDLFV